MIVKTDLPYGRVIKYYPANTEIKDEDFIWDRGYYHGTSEEVCLDVKDMNPFGASIRPSKSYSFDTWIIGVPCKPESNEYGEVFP